MFFKKCLRMLTHQLTDHHKQSLVVVVFTVVLLNVAALDMAIK